MEEDKNGWYIVYWFIDAWVVEAFCGEVKPASHKLVGEFKAKYRWNGQWLDEKPDK